MNLDGETYDSLTANFTWRVPPRYNIGVDTCDKWADGSGRLALIYEDADQALGLLYTAMLAGGHTCAHHQGDHVRQVDVCAYGAGRLSPGQEHVEAVLHPFFDPFFDRGNKVVRDRAAGDPIDEAVIQLRVVMEGSHAEESFLGKKLLRLDATRDGRDPQMHLRKLPGTA